MTFLPIVDRELRVRARLRSTYRVRLLAAIGAILIVTVLLLANLAFGQSPGLGLSIFITLAGLSFVYCLMEGARNTADCLSEEKREGTLGLLFLTDLRGYDVVVGKLVASSVNSFYGLLAIFPALAIPLVLGGVTPGEFWRVVLSLINTLFFSLTFGLLISAVTRDERRTWMLTATGVAMVTVGPPFLLLAPNAMASLGASASPFTAFLGAYDSSYAGQPARYWDSIRAVQFVSWFCLVAASVLLPRRWQDRPVVRSRRAPRRTGASNRDGLRRKARLLDENPVLWLASRTNAPPIALWLLVLGAGAVGLTFLLLTDGSGSLGPTLVFAMVLLHLALSVWVASEACHALGAARDTGALELLLATPLTTRQIVEGHLLGLKRIFFKPFATLIGIELLILVADYYVSVDTAEIDLLAIILRGGVVFLILIAVLEFRAVAAFGLWMGLTTKRPATAVTKTVLYVVVLPLISLLFFPVYPFISMVKSIVFISYGQDQLRRHFRAVLAERFGAGGRPELITDRPKRALRGTLPPVLSR